MNYKLIHDEVFIGDDGDAPYELFFNKKAIAAQYIAVRGEEVRTFIVLKHPEEMSAVEKDRVLSYCVGDDYKHGKVNYTDLFLQGEFIKELKSEGKRIQT